MTELSQHIGPHVDVPAGDIGVGPREIGFMFGQYKKLHGYHPATLTGKGLHYGGSLGRTEATGYGTVYFVDEMLRGAGHSLKDKTVVVSGSGNVSIYAIEKVTELGAKVVACSDSDGYIYDENGIDLDLVKQLKEVESKRIYEYTQTHTQAQYHKNQTNIWDIPCDVALPCATQNEIDGVSAQKLIDNNVLAIAEGANMPSNPEAIDVFLDNHILYGPGKAVNAGGVAVSALEMTQNSTRYPWTFEEVDEKLQEIMTSIYNNSMEAAETYGHSGNLLAGANIAGFLKVAEAMADQGIV